MNAIPGSGIGSSYVDVASVASSFSRGRRDLAETRHSGGATNRSCTLPFSPSSRLCFRPNNFPHRLTGKARNNPEKRRQTFRWVALLLSGQTQLLEAKPATATTAVYGRSTIRRVARVCASNDQKFKTYDPKRRGQDQLIGTGTPPLPELSCQLCTQLLSLPNHWIPSAAPSPHCTRPFAYIINGLLQDD